MKTAGGPQAPGRRRPSPSDSGFPAAPPPPHALHPGRGGPGGLPTARPPHLPAWRFRGAPPPRGSQREGWGTPVPGGPTGLCAAGAAAAVPHPQRARRTQCPVKTPRPAPWEGGSGVELRPLNRGQGTCGGCGLPSHP